jgi:hypothetical protein
VIEENAMPVDEHAEEVLRQFEASVLDTHHKTLPLWTIDRSTATYGVLAQFDSFAIMGLLFPPAFEHVGLAQTVKGLEEALSQAIRWLHPGDPAFDLTSTDDRSIIGLAGDYAAFAKTYVDIADMHKMYGRKQLTIAVDEQQRRVRFLRLPDKPRAAASVGMVEGTHQLSRLPLVRNPAAMENLFREIRRSLDVAACNYIAGRVILQDMTVANSAVIRELLEGTFPREPLQLPGDTDLSGFTADELTAYYEALKRWSFCTTFLFIFSVLERGKQQWECLPTPVIERRSFLQSMLILSGLPMAKVGAITSRLTYDDRTAVPEVFQQPLFCGPACVAWSAQAVLSSKYHRNMLKLMSRTPALRELSATLIGSREQAMLRELGALLSSKGGCGYKLNTDVEHGGERGEIDLLAYNLKFPDELLLVEGKASLGVDEINEVDAATLDMQKGQKQLGNVEMILEGMSEEEKRHLFKFVNWPFVKQVFGLVVSADAEPNGKFDHSHYPGISLQTMKARLRDNHFASPRKIWAACKERKWLAWLVHYDESYVPVVVGDVTYELPVLTGSRHSEGPGR